ncbi:hypothetical protein [Erythrobacter sp. JK5]|uniref:hypothetical protein n=1 Tax=Erythrobacter sp. JK5 TaxID=2829500 RepID=UPI001BAAAD2D|nr:hypothetical protein [Erythrobacter sp. JK5]QUL36848.1 hypothetical protein KDC96_10530 [Erythrobacter sp. JK5]
MPALDRSYTSDHEVRADGSVAFACSQDVREWPWLALPPQHPLVIQTQNFWTSVGATQAAGTRDDSKWSALTWTDWVLGDRAAGIAARGLFERTDDNDKLEFAIELFDAQDRLIARIRGRGVVFRTRDFESWRDKSKVKARDAAAETGVFDYAPREQLGLSSVEPPLIAPLREQDGSLTTTALITKENGLMPGHPYFSGSGDHVNTPHLAEVARQVACLLCDGRQVTITSAEMDMHRYIELDTPIEISIDVVAENRMTLSVSQLERSCATIAMEWA